MGTTADKLEYLQSTKAAIKQAIVAKGVDVPDGTTFREYATKISDIQDVSSLPTQGAKTVTPTTSEQTAVASGRYTTGDVKVAGDANLVPENIAEGKSIFGVLGTHSGLGKEVTAHIGSGPNAMSMWYASGKTDAILISNPNQNYTVVVPSIIIVLGQPPLVDLNYSGGIKKINWGSGMSLQLYYVSDEFWLST